MWFKNLAKFVENRPDLQTDEMVVYIKNTIYCKRKRAEKTQVLRELFRELRIPNELRPNSIRDSVQMLSCLGSIIERKIHIDKFGLHVGMAVFVERRSATIVNFATDLTVVCRFVNGKSQSGYSPKKIIPRSA